MKIPKVLDSSVLVAEDLILSDDFNKLINSNIVGAALHDRALRLFTKFSNIKSTEDVLTCIQFSDVLLDITWEKLNTGHWKDVADDWHYMYTFVSIVKSVSQCLKAEGSSLSTDHSDYSESIVTCDRGLIMGAPVLNNALRKIVSTLQLFVMQNSSTNEQCSCRVKRPKLDLSSFKLKNELSRISCPSLEYFRKNFVDLEEPVILEDCIDYWPALKNHKWCLHYLKRVCGCRIVPVEIGSKYTDENWSQKLMTIREFIEGYFEPDRTAGTKIAYLAQHQLFDQIPELQNDIVVPTYCCLGESADVDINAWFGPKGTVSPLHHDPKHNFLAQVVGEKFIKLFSKEQSKYLYPHDTVLLNNTSQIDVENPDLEKFPLYENAVTKECILKSGDMLYIPPKYWHFVKSLSISFSVSFWWE